MIEHKSVKTGNGCSMTMRNHPVKGWQFWSWQGGWRKSLWSCKTLCIFESEYEVSWDDTWAEPEFEETK